MRCRAGTFYFKRMVNWNEVSAAGRVAQLVRAPASHEPKSTTTSCYIERQIAKKSRGPASTYFAFGCRIASCRYGS